MNTQTHYTQDSNPMNTPLRTGFTSDEDKPIHKENEYVSQRNDYVYFWTMHLIDWLILILFESDYVQLKT